MENHSLFLSTPVVRELESLTRRVGEKIGRRRAKRFSQIVRRVLRKGKVVRLRRRISICRDPSDNMYLETAWSARAGIIVTRDRDILTLTADRLRAAGFRRLEILTPSTFLRRTTLQ